MRGWLFLFYTIDNNIEMNFLNQITTLRKFLLKFSFMLLAVSFFSINAIADTEDTEEIELIDTTETLEEKGVIDSTNINLLKNFNLQLIKIEEERKKDSIHKLDLIAQLKSLKTTDNLKKDELQKQLDNLNSAELKRISEKKSRIDSLRLTAKGYPVFGNFSDTLFYIYSSLGSFSPKDRAVVITERINKLRDNYPL